ncbi:MAG TPA: replication initiator A domain-containing protein [Lachnospiraceae bacterium]|nr:replication initiator A domain-containing protein [Lachnospiraceae bacterium]
MLFEYFYGREADKFMFYRIPKLLFELAGLKDMPVESKVMYGILLDRVGLSVENGWIDKEGRVYIIYTIPEAAAALGCSERKAFEIVKELESRGLVEKKRRGMGKPNLIYVKNFLTEMQNLQLKNCKICNSRTANPAIHEMQNMQPNNNYKNNTDMNNTDYESIREVKPDAGMEEREIYKELVKDNMMYGELIRGHPLQREIIEQTVDLMVDVMCSKEPTIRIGRDDKPQRVVKSMFSKLKREHIEYVLECLKKNDKEIHNIRQYLISALYNATMTMAAYRETTGSRELEKTYEGG